MAQILVGAPVLSEFDRSAAQVTVGLLELGFEAAKEREGIGGGSGESCQDFFLIEAADFFRFVLDDGLAQSHLAVARHHDLVVTANAEDGGGADAACGSSVVWVFVLY